MHLAAQIKKMGIKVNNKFYIILASAFLAAASFSIAAKAVEKDEIKEDAESQIPDFDDEDKWNYLSYAKLQGLNKITLKNIDIITRIGETAKFGNLDITVKKCAKKPSSELKENAALLEIYDEIPGQIREKRFYGWMFSASPALSALEHPIYDVILVECLKNPAKNTEKKEEKKEEKPSKTETKKQ